VRRRYKWLMAVATGERRIVTVLFADLVDSTSIAERLGAERSKFLVDEVMRVMSAEVERYEGTVAGYAGDELYAVFGAPTSHEDDSERAVRAALAIQRALERYAGEVREAYGIDLAARIAINTGPVVIQPDSDEPYNALGDTANVASRIQKLVSGGEIVVARPTKLQVETCFALESLGAQALRGVSEPVETFKILGPAAESEPRELQPLVGRDFELTVLERAMDGLVDGRGAIVAVVGEPGIGKTRLVAEVRARYADRVRFVEGRAVSYAQSFPYWPIRDLLREWLGAGASTPEARVRLELKAQLAELFEDAEDVYPFVGSLLGIQLEPDAQQRLRDLNRESIQTRQFDVLAELVCRLSRDTPLCIVLDDLHWADEATLDLLEHLLAVTDEASVALFLLYRTERDHRSWRLGEFARSRYPHRYKEIELRPLPNDASRSLAHHAAGAELPDSVAELLAERAGGNPFFLEEALRDLVERGALRRENEHYALAVGEDELVVPALVQGALQARLDRLDPAAREVLSTAAVAGRTFGLPLLESVLPREQVVAALSELQRLELVVEVRRRPAPEYRFRHGLVQEVAYASLVETRRRRLHLQVGEAIERLTADAPEPYYALLARHFAEADEPTKAADYLLRAGDAARAVYADQEAVMHYERARSFLARTGDDTRSRETLFKIALAKHLAFDFAGAEDAYDEAFCCGVETPLRLEPTETISTPVALSTDVLVPGHVYSTESVGVVGHLFRGLLAVDRDLNVVPSLADNFRVSADGLQYLFRIREGARWSDGHPVTAEDFAWTWRQMGEEDVVSAFMLDGVEARAIDDRTLEVTLDRPRSYFPFVFASVWTYPWPKHVCERLGAGWKTAEPVVSNGPFMLAERGERELVLRANPHWAGARGNVGEIRIEIAGTQAALAGWAEGRYDVLGTTWPTGASTSDDTIEETYSNLSLQFLGFGVRQPPFDHGLLRKAVAHALDRERIAASLSLVSLPATRGGLVPPAMPGHSHKIGIHHDPELARKLLAEAGHPDGRGLPKLRMILSRDMNPEPFVEQLGALGIVVDPVVSSGPVGPRQVLDYHLWATGWTADFPDPEGLFQGFFGDEWPLYRDEEVEDLLERARCSQVQSERMRLFHELDRLWVGERAAVVPLLYSRSKLLRRPWVEGAWANAQWGVALDNAVVSR
jgi:ABC-type transport system substrate-binding protein/class 3 adenylate cyclase